MNEIGKIPPQAVEVEQAVLGALLLESESFEAISHLLTKESFYDHRHGKIFETILNMAKTGKPIDLVTVTRELKDRSLLEQVGGPLFITQLAIQAPMAANLEYHARLIVEKYVVREMIRVLSELMVKAYDPANDVEQLLVDLQQAGNSLEKHFEAGDTGAAQRIVAKDTLTEIYQDVEKNRNGHSPGISTGFKELNEALGGWRPTNLIILAARPGIGKTSLALHFAVVAAKAGYFVNFFSLEMTGKQLFKILLAGASQVSRTQIRDGILNNAELKQIDRVTGQLEDLPIVWNDKPINISNLKSKVKRNHKAGHCGLVIIDYLQLIEPTDRKAIREQQISEISRTLKGMALELQIPVICLSQLNRMAENDIPQLHHLRESGAIEQDADVVLFPYRPSPYELKLIIGKSRHGRTGTIDIWANDQMTHFGDTSPTATTGFDRIEQTIHSKNNKNKTTF